MMTRMKLSLSTYKGPDLPSLEDFEPEEMIERLGVTKAASKAGQRNFPPPAALNLDFNELQFVREHRRLAEKAKRDYTDRIQQVELERRRALDKLDAGQLDQVKADACETLARLKIEGHDSLKQAWEDRSKATRALRAFQTDHDISRDAEYPKNPVYDYVLVVATAVVEAIANAGFFAEGSDIGFFGGAQQATIVAGFNIGLSFLAGMGLRGFNVSGMRRCVAAATAAAYPVWSVIYNLTIGAYRNALATSPETAATQSIANFLDNPFAPLGDFNSILLIVTGMLCGAIALWKGYESDDKIPGYGKVDRKLKAAANEFQAKQEELYGAVQTAKEAAITRVIEIVDNSDEAFHSFCSTTTELKRLICNYYGAFSAINSSLADVIRHYRERNSQVRDTPAPKYFVDDAPQLDLDEFTLENADSLAADKALAAARKKLDDLKPAADRSKLQLTTLFTHCITSLPAYFVSLADKAPRFDEESDESGMGGVHEPKVVH